MSSDKQIPDNLLSVEDLAAATNESVAVWRKRILHREIDYFKCGRNVRVKRGDLEQWLQARMVGAER